ncbi:ABC transporter permease [Roseivirga seohaensis]|uniref:ABC transporter permease n=1 Tax=Roseivirga seohaensis TaxID=1914963 RepID=UPI003BADA17A
MSINSNNFQSNSSAKWLFLMAWRDARKSKSRLFLFISSIILGIAALVAINSFSENLKEDINGQAKELLGADLELSANKDDFSYPFLDTLDYEVSSENSFASMVYFPKNQGSRLVDVRALEGAFPFYGVIESNPASAAQSFRDGQAKALVDQSVLVQYDVQVGDSVRIGKVTFLIEGALISSPSQSMAATLVAPAVYIPMKYVEATGLIQKGSRVQYRKFYKLNDLDPEFDLDEQLRTDREYLRTEGIRGDTVEERKRDTGRTFEDLSSFLNLVAFVALLLGCVGVASAVHIYIKEKIRTVAILRCLGAKGRDTFLIYLIQIGVIGLIGATIGAFSGTLLQTILPKVFADFLPVEVNFSISWPSILGGIATGLVVSILFALTPLLAIRKASPLLTLRNTPDGENGARDPLRWLVFAGIFIFIFGFAYLQIGDLSNSFVFTISVLMAFGFLVLIARLAMWAVKKFFPTGWSYLWRQSLANLYRPNNQTTILIASIGLGTALITTLYFIQGLLISQVEITTDAGRPNMMLFDIQSYQKDEIADFTKAQGLPVLQQVPVVTMRLSKINGNTLADVMADSTLNYRSGAFNREWRITYRDSLIDSEKLVEGEFRTMNSESDSVFVTIEKGYAESSRIKLGDELIWNVQGVPITTYVGGFREIDWERVQTNFLVLFPEGVLERAPQFHVLITRVKSTEEGALYQRDIVKKYPNVSVIDIGLILTTVDEILGKISFVIRFMALFSIVTGLLVLIGSVILSKFQRIRESILLRTLGGSKRQILTINSLEYFVLGSLASLSGIMLALLGSWALAYFTFETSFVPNILPVLLVYVSITSLTVLIGLLNSRGILSKSPLEVLRSEIQ